jgi:putative transposase
MGRKQREGGIWQRRFWEHMIRDAADYKAHLDYIHYNPAKHGLVNAPKDWECSSFHRHVDAGIYTNGWGINTAAPLRDIGNE